MKLSFNKTRETKNKVRYDEVDSDFVGALYVSKEAIEELGDPEVIVVTIDAE
jgi:hypothetical protein